MLPEAEIHHRLDEVRARIADALARAHRAPASCRLVLATKTQPAEALLAAYHAGARDFGENYVQEAASKRSAFEQLRSTGICHPERSESSSGVEGPARSDYRSAPSLPKGPPRSDYRSVSGRAEGREFTAQQLGRGPTRKIDLSPPSHSGKGAGGLGLVGEPSSSDFPITWHLIGHLQTNKAATALATFSLIETLDSARLAATLHRLQPSPPVRTLLEINLGGETSKTGVAPADAERLLDSIRSQVEVLGLMTIPPHSVDPSASRPYFVQLRELRDRLAVVSGLALSELSMGMTDDYTIAIEEGATIVRVGRAVFGERT